MKKITFTRQVIKTISMTEVCTLDLEREAKWIEYPEGVTAEDVVAWAESDHWSDQDKLSNFVWENECYAELDYDEWDQCYDSQLEEIYDIGAK
jgi:hypothetical protein